MYFLCVGQQYKKNHRNEDWSNELPPVSVIKPLTNQEEVEFWLFQSLGMRLAPEKLRSNPETVVLCGLYLSVALGNILYSS